MLLSIPPADIRKNLKVPFQKLLYLDYDYVRAEKYIILRTFVINFFALFILVPCVIQLFFPNYPSEIIHISAHEMHRYYYMEIGPDNVIFPLWIISSIYVIVLILWRTKYFSRNDPYVNAHIPDPKSPGVGKQIFQHYVPTFLIIGAIFTMLERAPMYFVHHSAFYSKIYDVSELSVSNLVVLYVAFSTVYLLLICYFLDIFVVSIKVILARYIYK
jgi:hypothetical protein